jgi:hypothetical protein
VGRSSSELVNAAWRMIVVAAPAAIGVGLGLLMAGLRFDDPFITYRFADHLARGLGFTFNPGAPDQALITTAPLYALLLGALAAAGLDIPTASYGLSMLGLIATAWALTAIGKRHGLTGHGFLAGLVFVAFPLAWLTVGFETPLFMALSTWALFFAESERPAWAGALAGLGLGLRGDGAIVLGIVLLRALRFGEAGWRARLRPALVALATASATYGPLAIFLTAQFGSPIPTTLQTKSAQAIAGLTGFYAGTRFLEGALLLVRAYLEQEAIFLFVPLAVGLGTFSVIRRSVVAARAQGWRWPAAVPFLLPIAWAVLHLAGYTLLGVAPYAWYYAPMLPGLAALIALGVYKWQTLPLILLPLISADLSMIEIVRGGVPPPPAEVRSKVLPETKVDIYERAGRWLNANTPATATLGVTELGVMSYYAQRTTYDFLGLTLPSQLPAIRRGDFVGGLLRLQPDYLALTGVNALYDANPQQDDWFNALYAPVARLEDARFWGSPITIWQRVRPPIRPDVLLDQDIHELGDGWQVTGVAVSAREVITTVPLIISVRLKAGSPLGQRELRVQPIATQRGDGLPVRSRIIHTNQFYAGEEAWYDFPLLPYPDARKGAYDISIRWLDGDREVIAGRIKVPLGAQADPGTSWLPLSAGFGAARLPRPLVGCPGETVAITVTWRASGPLDADYVVFLHLRDQDERVVAQADGPPRNGSYPPTVWSAGEVIPDPRLLVLPDALRPGSYAVVVGLYHPQTGARWPVEDSPARTPDGGLRIGALRVGQCGP